MLKHSSWTLVWLVPTLKRREGGGGGFEDRSVSTTVVPDSSFNFIAYKFKETLFWLLICIQQHSKLVLLPFEKQSVIQLTTRDVDNNREPRKIPGYQINFPGWKTFYGLSIVNCTTFLYNSWLIGTSDFENFQNQEYLLITNCTRTLCDFLFIVRSAKLRIVWSCTTCKLLRIVIN